MKKFLALVLTVLSIGFTASAVEAKTAAPKSAATVTTAAEPQINVRIGNKRRRRRVVRRRVVVTRRVSRNGRRVVTRRVVRRYRHR